MRTRLLAPIAVFVLVVAACGDSGGDTTTTETADATTTSAATGGDDTTTTTGPASGGDTSTTTLASGTTAASGGGGDVAELLEQFQSTPLRATYLFDEGDSEQRLTLSQDPTADPPLSALISEDDGFHVIFTGGAMTICDADQEQCFATPEQPGVDNTLLAGAFLSPFLSSFLAFSVSNTTPGVDLSTEPIEVAGRSGLCFTLSPDAGFGADFDEVRQCVDDETGAILLFETREGGGDFVRLMELVELGEPLPSDFSPPFPLVALPGS